VACYHEGQGPKDTPFIAELYALPDYKHEHPLEPLDPWFRWVMSGNPTNYTILLKEVNNLWEWGLHAEVKRYCKLDGEIWYANNQIELMHCELEGLQTHHMLCEGCLIASCVQDKVGHLAGHFVPFLGSHHPSIRPCSGWRPKDKKGKGGAVTEDPSDE
jgi:hypothetical protein